MDALCHQLTLTRHKSLIAKTMFLLTTVLLLHTNTTVKLLLTITTAMSILTITTVMLLQTTTTAVLLLTTTNVMNEHGRFQAKPRYQTTLPADFYLLLHERRTEPPSQRFCSPASVSFF